MTIRPGRNCLLTHAYLGSSECLWVPEKIIRQEEEWERNTLTWGVCRIWDSVLCIILQNFMVQIQTGEETQHHLELILYQIFVVAQEWGFTWVTNANLCCRMNAISPLYYKNKRVAGSFEIPDWSVTWLPLPINKQLFTLHYPQKLNFINCFAIDSVPKLKQTADQQILTLQRGNFFGIQIMERFLRQNLAYFPHKIIHHTSLLKLSNNLHLSHPNY